MKSKLYLRALVILTLIFSFTISWAQITTATLNGVVADDKGETIIGAAVIATHTPSGSRYAAVTREDGLFTISNMRVGGPYSVKVTFVGYQDLEQGDVYLSR